MITVLKEYIKLRIDLKQLAGLTLLMAFLILSLENTSLDWCYTMVFLFGSFIVFRIFDDAFSVFEDRKEHPERTYLLAKKFKAFKKVTFISIVIYLVGISLVFFSSFYSILLLFIISISLYVLLKKQPFLFSLISLLKYPVLLYAASIFATMQPEPEILFSSFFLMLGYDSFDAVKKNPNQIWKPLLFLFCCSLLLFKPWDHLIYSLFMMVPLLIIYLFREHTYIPYFSIIIFPSLFFILTTL